MFVPALPSIRSFGLSLKFTGAHQVTNAGPVYLMWAAQVYAVAVQPATATPTPTASPLPTPTPAATPTPLPPAPPPAIPEADVLTLFGTGLAGVGGYAALRLRRLRRR